MFTRLFLLLLLATVSSNIEVSAADGPAKGIPELQALSNYIGTWDVAITSKDFPFPKGESKTIWLLDGRFVQQTGELKSADGSNSVKITTLMTYDSKSKTYRMWSFQSNGSTSEASGNWNETARTMTSTTRQDGMTMTTTARFSNDGTEEWSIVTMNQNNEVVARTTGTNTRRKQ